MVLGWSLVIFALLSGEPEEAEPLPDEGEAYCRFAQAVAESEAALLRAPEVFGSVGHFSTVGSGPEPAAGVQTTRILAGLRYDVADLVRGNLVVRRARAECERYRAMVRLETALREGGEAALAPALAAKIGVLRNLLPSLLQRMDALRADVMNANATADDLQAFRLRVDALRDAIVQAELALVHWQGEQKESPAPNLPSLLEEYWKADREVEEAEGALRRARAFGLELRGGYEELLTVEQGVPLFGIVTLSYNLGHLWQGSSNRRAREARQDWRRLRGGPPGSHRIAEALEQLEATRTHQRKRLEEVSVLARDIQQQLREVEQIETRKVNRFRDLLMLEAARLEAERVFLERYVEELDRFLGPAPEVLPSPAPERGTADGRREESDRPLPARVPSIRVRR